MSYPPAKRPKLETPTPPSPNILVIPAEILQRIIEQIDHNDKPTLGRCMRLSSAFNALAGPRLYNTLTLGETSGLSDPFGVPKRGVFDIPVKKAWLQKTKDKMKTQGKERDLGYIRHVFLKGTFNLSQFPKITELSDKGKHLKSVKSIRLRFSSSPGDFHHKHMNEMIARFTNLEKLVFAGTSHLPKAPLDRLSSTCTKGVIVIEPYLGMCPPIDWTSKSLQSIVYIWLNPAGYKAKGQLKELLRVFIEAANKKGYLKTITLVNFPEIRTSRRGETTIGEYLVRKLQGGYNLTDIPSDPTTQTGNPKTQTDKTPSPLQHPIIKMISMYTYLRDNDWKGELTDEEVRPWLEEEEAERAAARKEKHDAIGYPAE